MKRQGFALVVERGLAPSEKASLRPPWISTYPRTLRPRQSRDDANEPTSRNHHPNNQSQWHPSVGMYDPVYDPFESGGSNDV
jgi:hypothetical protein